jgi:4-hydroxy-tetrahydrodipicolinate reductase
MKIGLIGYGKMGKIIEEIAIDRGHEIVARLTSTAADQDWEELNAADVCIEFTRPESALANFNRCLENGISVVTGTTGWYAQMESVKTKYNKEDGSFFWASNFSIGVNLFWQINKKLAELMALQPSYTSSMIEIHHTQKLDEPSGTAITTANQIIERIPAYTDWKLDSEPHTTSDLIIESHREGDVKGTHIVNYDSDVDRIQIMHEAKSRKGFALGAVLAAEFLNGKNGWFTMEDMLRF